MLGSEAGRLCRREDAAELVLDAAESQLNAGGFPHPRKLAVELVGFLETKVKSVKEIAPPLQTHFAWSHLSLKVTTFYSTMTLLLFSTEVPFETLTDEGRHGRLEEYAALLGVEWHPRMDKFWSSDTEPCVFFVERDLCDDKEDALERRTVRFLIYDIRLTDYYEIHVKHVDSLDEFTVKVHLDGSVAALRSAVYEKCGIHPSAQKLCTSGGSSFDKALSLRKNGVSKSTAVLLFSS